MEITNLTKVIQSARPDTQLSPHQWRVEVSTPSPHEVTGLLDAWSQGDKTALDKIDAACL